MNPVEVSENCVIKMELDLPDNIENKNLDKTKSEILQTEKKNADSQSIWNKDFCFKTDYEKHKKKYVTQHMFHKCCKKGESIKFHKLKKVLLKRKKFKANNDEEFFINGSDNYKSKQDLHFDCVEKTKKENYDNDVTDEEDENDEEVDENQIYKKRSCQKKFEQSACNNIYKCQQCLELFNKYSNLSQHIKEIHKKQVKLKCATCSEGFDTNEDYQSHVSQHGPEDKVLCRGCHKTFDSLKQFYIHAKQNPGMHCFICKLCLRKFPTELMLEQHVCIWQNGKPLYCACGREFTRYEDVIEHSKGTKPFSCCSCSHLSTSLTAYIRHLRKHSKQKPYQCNKCDMKFAVIDFLNIHNKKFHTEGNEPLKEQILEFNQIEKHICGHCEEEFKKGEELKAHEERFHKEKFLPEDERVQCPDCGKLLKKSRLENHRNSHKTSASLCPECGKLFDTRFKLTQHIITAHSNQPVKCQVCMKILKTKKILNEHLKTHLKSEQGGRIPQAICPMCGLGLAQKGSLARHILLTHEKHKIVPCDKTYVCQECSAELPNRAKYYSHRRMHRAMIDRFPCEVCGREFNKKQNLRRHMYLLHDETRVLAEPIFKCQFCTRRFREKKNLKRHYKMVHKVDDII